TGASAGGLDQAMTTAARIAVIVPFYQTESGILRRTLTGALAQAGADSLDSIVVEDGSPVPAAGEIAGLATAPGRRIRVVVQANAGPGAARNAGLDQVAPETDYVALLDADDHWTADHLSRAIACLDRGYDLYFSDFRSLDGETTIFGLRGFDPAAHDPLTGIADAHAYRGDMTARVVGPDNVIKTPTLVFRRAAFADIRFPADLTFGEDLTFFLALCARRPRICFSARVECAYGEGLNIYAKSGWGTEGERRRLLEEMRFRTTLPRRVTLSPDERRINRRMAAAIRRAYTAAFLHNARRGRPGLAHALRFARLDPAFALLFPATLIRALGRRG
ncbi:MAG: glycosyltransferase family 2 protein, partial [Alphaproteobacteria bacterium]|nr:glycosyltransferase family 2 protein [Alphaproteobacteria bacterium]